jgi:hypothetical protein
MNIIASTKKAPNGFLDNFGYCEDWFPDPKNKAQVESNRRFSVITSSFDIAIKATGSRAQGHKSGGFYHIDYPGGIFYDPKIAEISSGKFDSVFFGNGGSYSTRSIYRHVRGSMDDFPYGFFATDEFIETLSEGQRLTFKNSVLGKVIGSSRLESEKDCYRYICIKRDLFRLEISEYEENNKTTDLSNVVRFGRYIPVITIGAHGCNSENLVINRDFSLSEFRSGPFNGTDSANALRSYILSEVYSDLRNFHNGGRDTVYRIVFYDEEEHNLILSEELLDQISRLLLKNKEAFLASLCEHTSKIEDLIGVDDIDGDVSSESCLEKEAEELVSLMPPMDFKVRFNAYMKEKNLEGFKAIAVVPSIQKGFWTYRDFIEEETYNHLTSDAGYYVIVEYDGKKVIGPETYCQFLFVADEGEQIRLVHSAWCQHVSAWSVNADVTDQSYSNWEISDWLSGPFAERANLKVKEAPTIFYGNKNRASKTKFQIMEDLRARMSNLV